MAADAYSKIAIPSIADGHYQSCCGTKSAHAILSRMIPCWNSFSKISSVKDLELHERSIRTICVACGYDFLEDKIDSFKKALKALPPVVVFRP